MEMKTERKEISLASLTLVNIITNMEYAYSWFLTQGYVRHTA